VGALELGGKHAEALQRRRVVGQLPRGAQAALDGRAVSLGQVLEHVALLVAVMPTSA